MYNVSDVIRIGEIYLSYIKNLPIGIITKDRYLGFGCAIQGDCDIIITENGQTAIQCNANCKILHRKHRELNLPDGSKWLITRQTYRETKTKVILMP